MTRWVGKANARTFMGLDAARFQQANPWITASSCCIRGDSYLADERSLTAHDANAPAPRSAIPLGIHFSAVGRRRCPGRATVVCDALISLVLAPACPHHQSQASQEGARQSGHCLSGKVADRARCDCLGTLGKPRPCHGGNDADRSARRPP